MRDIPMVDIERFARLSIPGQHYVLLSAMRMFLFIVLGKLYSDVGLRVESMKAFDASTVAATERTERVGL